jgi:uncharacterized alpha-E superfamily protein
MQPVKLASMSPGQLASFLQSVKETSLRFDGAAYRTMLRTDHFWFQRLARATYARLQNSETENIFQSGLHEFLTEFITENNRLASSISEQYLS